MITTVNLNRPTIAQARAAGTASGPARFVRAVHAEWIKLTRPRALAVCGAAVAVIAAGGTAIGMATVRDAPARVAGSPDTRITTGTLELAGGSTRLFSQTMGFMSAFLLAMFVAVVAVEFSRGTFRTMLLQEPGRARVFAGKLTAIVGFTICAVAVGELASIAMSFAMASSQDVDKSQWLTADGLAHAGEALARAAGYVLVSAVIAAVVGVLARSVPIGVGITLVWFGPIENIIGDGTSAGERYFPGLLLRALISPGSTSVGTGEALATLAVYSVIAAGVGAIALRRRDVTS
jgi:ABC-type transport system involved in multi-copper enzyme maturation permease subunit